MDLDRKAVLWLAIEDYAGLREVIWELRTLHRQNADEELFQHGRSIISEFLALEWIRLYWCNEPYGDLTAVPPGEAKIIASLDSSWEEPEAGAKSVRVGATPIGEKVYGYRLTSHGDRNQSPDDDQRPIHASLQPRLGRVVAVRAALRSIDSYDVDDLATWQPDGPDFAVMMRLLVGPADGPGEESFDVVVCTGGWLESRATSSPWDTRHHTVVSSFDWPALRQHFERQVEACTGENWDEVAQQLSRIGRWEFEDYRA